MTKKVRNTHALRRQDDHMLDVLAESAEHRRKSSAFFQGRFEMGAARARQTAASWRDPRSEAMKEVVNTKIKFPRAVSRPVRPPSHPAATVPPSFSIIPASSSTKRRATCSWSGPIKPEKAGADSGRVMPSGNRSSADELSARRNPALLTVLIERFGRAELGCRSAKYLVLTLRRRADCLLPA